MLVPIITHRTHSSRLFIHLACGNTADIQQYQSQVVTIL